MTGDDKTVGTISATEYARLREADAKVARVEALIDGLVRAIENAPPSSYVAEAVRDVIGGLRAALSGDIEADA